MADAGIRKQARQGIELRIPIGHSALRGLEDFALVKQMGWNQGGADRNQCGRVVHVTPLPMLPQHKNLRIKPIFRWRRDRAT